jgi:hypothetical protein
MNSNPSINVNNLTILIRKLEKQSKRVIISLVSPIISHSYITNALNNMNIKTLIPIRFLKADFTTDDFSHIISFRRQTHIPHEDISKLPGSLVINFYNTDYQVSLTDDALIYYLCKKTGHTSAYCKNMSVLSSNPLDYQTNYYIQLPNNTSNSQIITNIISKETPNNIQFNAIEKMESEHIEEPPNKTLSPFNSTLSFHLQMHYTKINEEKTHTQIPNAIHKRHMSETSSSKSFPSPTNLTPKLQKLENTKTTKKSKFFLALTHLH